MTIEVRTTRDDELRQASAVVSTALLGPIANDEQWAERRDSWTSMSSVTAWDGDRCVGHAGQFPVDTVVPGGARVPTAAVTRVGVLPTDRRRGIARELMRRLVSDSVEAGHVLMSLRASETRIYGRFGFGMAGEAANVEIDATASSPLDAPRTGGTFELVAADRLHDTIPAVYDAAAMRRPGAISRPTPAWWRRELAIATEQKKAAWVVVHRSEDGVADGYVLYEAGWNDDAPDEAPTGRGEVHELFGTDDAVELALWQYLLDIDLVTHWRANGRPVDDPIRFAARDTRAVRVRAIEDEQWVRIVDVGAALAARSYCAGRSGIVIGVTDDRIPSNNGAWRIDPDGVAATDDSPDLGVDIATLSAVYLGGRSWTSLAGLGRVGVHDSAALSHADVLFGAPAAPFCGTFF